MRKGLAEVERGKRVVREMAKEQDMTPNEYMRAWVTIAETVYKVYHNDKLPGSLRTARLRKKRTVKVMKWFARKVEKSPGVSVDRRSNLELAC